MKAIAAGLVLAIGLAVPAADEEIVEPRSGVRFPARHGDLSLLGVGLRTKTLFKVKVYAIGFYVAEAALVGPLAAHKGKLDSPELYRDLVWGDFDKQIILKFVRDVTRAEVQAGFREALPRVNMARMDVFASYMKDTKQGQEYALRWAPGGVLETSFAGQPNAPIPDKDFAAAVFGIWLGERPIQADIKRDLVWRAPELIR